MLYLDLETRSQGDLIFHGLRRYAEHPTTELISIAYAFDDDEIVFRWATDPFPQSIIDHINDGGLLMAHNAEFERHIFKYVLTRTHGVPEPRIEQWRCSMAMALANGYAAGLDAMAKGLGLPYQKNPHGTRLIREYSAPGHKDIFA